MLSWVDLPVSDQYDSFADGYEEHATVAPYNALYDRPAMLRLVGDVESCRVLDAGCGPGLYLTELIARGARACGCDASPRMIELARRRVGDTVDLRVQSLGEPFVWLADESIDIALCALAYHYVNDRGAFLSELSRVLTPTGALVISTHHPTADWKRLGGSYFETTAATEVWSKGWSVTAWRTPLTLLCEEFADAGFVIERLIEPLPEPAMQQSHPSDFAKLSTEPGFVMFKLRKAVSLG